MKGGCDRQQIKTQMKVGKCLAYSSSISFARAA